MEKRWEYDCNLIFRGQKIIKFTLTDHFQLNHSEIKKEMIVELIRKLNDREAELTDYQGSRKVFRWKTNYQGQK
ncbi:MAG: hypothetical protein I3273_06430 [Candidatus Moeniiplasma glomeromycotorum]|nr:hypothetical protein [Candidatus Moeniiplasma glomeromycotorum]MCE8168395.1 hypothetical protein [Candidatus Moeniiplasma glomeromycotorum]MCE8169721.1 hypothetical protein [Candidatus Moeniiplasma glomeromycotorum]